MPFLERPQLARESWKSGSARAALLAGQQPPALRPESWPPGVRSTRSYAYRDSSVKKFCTRNRNLGDSGGRFRASLKLTS